MWLDALRGMKARSGLKNEEIAFRSGVPIATVNKITAGVTKDPQLETIKRIVKCLGGTLEQLFDEESLASFSSVALDIATAYDAAPAPVQDAAYRVLEPFMAKKKSAAPKDGAAQSERVSFYAVARGGGDPVTGAAPVEAAESFKKKGEEALAEPPEPGI